MALTITYPAAPRTIGPGYRVTVHESSGPILVDDFYYAYIRPPGSGLTSLAKGSTPSFAALTADIILGWLVYPFATASEHWEVLTSGATCDLVAQHWTPSPLSMVDQVVVAGWTWDPTGGLADLVSQVILQNDPSTLGAILQAVTTTFPTT